MKFSPQVRFPANSRLIGVRQILGVRAPFQIAKAIVMFVAILVIQDMLLARGRAEESAGDKLVDRVRFCGSIFAEPDTEIAGMVGTFTTIWKTLQNPALLPTVQTSHTAKIRYFVNAVISDNGSPRFHPLILIASPWAAT